MVKYAELFLAMKLSYVNAMAELCERLGADVHEVTRVWGRPADWAGVFEARPGRWGGSRVCRKTRMR